MQRDLFNRGYSYTTSLPAYEENKEVKAAQASTLLKFISEGKNNLLALSEASGLPQSTVAGRVSDLKAANKVEYDGHIEYKGRKRKKIVVIN